MFACLVTIFAAVIDFISVFMNYINEKVWPKV